MAVNPKSLKVWGRGGGSGWFSVQKTLTMHWDGVEWSIVQSPNFGTHDNHLNAVSGTAGPQGTDVWAVGYYIDGTNSSINNLTLHWHSASRQWEIVPIPNQPNAQNTLRSVSALSANYVWTTSLFWSESRIMRWNGTQWNRISYTRAKSKKFGIFSKSGRTSNGTYFVSSCHNGRCSIIRIRVRTINLPMYRGR